LSAGVTDAIVLVPAGVVRDTLIAVEAPAAEMQRPYSVMKRTIPSGAKAVVPSNNVFVAPVHGIPLPIGKRMRKPRVLLDSVLDIIEKVAKD
jgi:hypothetical protein